MSKPFPYWFRISLVSSLAVLLTINPAFAGRFFKRGQSQECCPPPSCPQVVDCCQPAPIQCQAPTSSCESGYIVLDSIPSIPDCGCEIPSAGNATVVPQATEPSTELPLIGSEASPPPPATTTEPSTLFVPQPEASTEPKETTPPVEQPKAEVPSTDNAKPSLFGDDPKPADNPPNPFGGEAPKTTTPPADDLFGAPKGNDAPVTPPDVTPKSDDPFGASQPAPANDPLATPPANTPPANAAPADDLFGAPKSDAPKSDTKPADDLFGAPTPAADPAPQQPAPAGDDLFGAPKGDAKPADDLFGSPTPPAQDSAPAPAADDLFGAPKSDAKPADDLFGAPAGDTKPAEPKSDDLFGAPPSKPADDLFGTGNPVSTETKTKEEPKSEEGKSDEKSTNSIDDLFSANDSNFNGADFRVWFDNTGTFQTKAQLATIYPDRIKLLKENGKVTTVPMRRLSDSDKLYVQWVAASLSKQNKLKYVQAPASMSESGTN